MIQFRVLNFFLISCFVLSNTLIAQETNIGSNNEVPKGTLDLDSNRIFYKVSESRVKKIFRQAVTEYIVANKGIQNFYSVPDVEKNWLISILQSEKIWHDQLLKLEQDYRNAFQNRVGLNSGQNDIAVRIENYTNNISKIDIDKRYFVDW